MLSFAQDNGNRLNREQIDPHEWDTEGMTTKRGLKKRGKQYYTEAMDQESERDETIDNENLIRPNIKNEENRHSLLQVGKKGRYRTNGQVETDPTISPRGIKGFPEDSSLPLVSVAMSISGVGYSIEDDDDETDRMQHLDKEPNNVKKHQAEADAQKVSI